MAYGYLLAFVVWAAKTFFFAESGETVTGIANVLIWIAVVIATAGALWFAFRFFRSLSGN